jgi:hypothetical protein
VAVRAGRLVVPQGQQQDDQNRPEPSAREPADLALYHLHMAIRSVSFDDDSEDDLCVFSGDDLVVTHVDGPDLDWEEVAERSALDERRGLVIAQVAVLEEVIDELILYLVDPADPEGYQRGLDRKTIGPRIDELEQILVDLALLNEAISCLLSGLRSVVQRRNELAHGTLYRRSLQTVPIEEFGQRDVDLEWRIRSRRDRSSQRITMSELRNDLYEAVGSFMELLKLGDQLLQSAPRPRHFRGTRYLADPAP